MSNYKGIEDRERFSEELAQRFRKSLSPITLGRVTPARMGNPDTKAVVVPPNERVPGCSLWAYIEVDQTKEVVQVANTNAGITFDNSNYGLPVKLAKPNGSSIYHVLSVDENQLNSITGGALPSQVAQKSMMALVPSRWQELQPKSNGSLVVGITGGHIRINDTLYYLEDDDVFIDLTSYVPSTSNKAKWVIVAHNGSSASVIEGSDFTIGENSPVDSLPSSMDRDKAHLFAVYLFNTQTSIEKKHFLALKTFHQTFTNNNQSSVSANDTTPDYLLNKLAAGTGITLTETNDGGDEDVTIASTDTYTANRFGVANAGATGYEPSSVLEESGNDVLPITTNIHNLGSKDKNFIGLFSAATTSNVLRPALSDTTNGDYYDDVSNSSYPPEYTEATAADSTAENFQKGYWFLNVGSSSTGFDYYFQTHQSIESLAANAFFGAKFFNLNFERSGTASTSDIYVGLYADNAGSIDTTKYVRANIQYDSGSSAWRVRSQTHDGTTATNGSWITLDTLPDQLFARTSIRNATTATGRIYLSKGLNSFSDQLVQSTNMTVTWGAPWLRVHCSKAAVDFIQFRIAGIDYTNDS